MHGNFTGKWPGLVFCGTRDKCRILAEQLAKLKFMDVNLGIGNSIEAREQFAHDALPRNEKDGSMSDIAKYITAGIAFHHAGMQVEERQAIEVAYKRGLVRIVCATSTLAAGVNMPAKSYRPRLTRWRNSKTSTEKSATDDWSRRSSRFRRSWQRVRFRQSRRSR